MRWIRKRSLVAAAFVVSYFFLVHSGRDGVIAAVAAVAGMVVVFGSALFDRILFDPSAIYIHKPWRIMQPSAGDVFRLISFGFMTILTVPIVILRGSFVDDAALTEASVLASVLFVYELIRHQIQRVRWHGTGLEVRSKFGRQISMKWLDVRNIRRSTFGEYVVFRDNKGRLVKISARLKGFSEFMRDAERYVPRDAQSDIRALK